MTDTATDPIDLNRAIRLLSDVVILEAKRDAADERIDQAKRGQAKRESELADAQAAVVAAADAADLADGRLADAVTAAKIIPEGLLEAATAVVAHGRLTKQAGLDALAAAREAARNGDTTTADRIRAQLTDFGIVGAPAQTAHVTTAASDAGKES